MKFTVTSIPTVSKVGSGVGQNEEKSARVKRMRGWLAAPANAVLHPIGQLLAAPTGETHGDGTPVTLADNLVNGASIEIDAVPANGVTLELRQGFAISLKNVAVWGCPACRSAHGSGVYPSREESAQRLAKNLFYYRPSDKTVFTISETCFGQYVKALGGATADRFAPATVPVAPVAPEAPATVPATPATVPVAPVAPANKRK